jgi:hypothetical protein
MNRGRNNTKNSLLGKDNVLETQTLSMAQQGKKGLNYETVKAGAFPPCSCGWFQLGCRK